uniref:Uncharacterized protein n=1 Tax=Leptobrachium leishanense TaxID=445787 RepID=A0A8C5MQI6_9ANUR
MSHLFSACASIKLSQPTSVAPMYDTVADFPVYAVVDKTKKKPHPPNVNDNVQYAVIEVVKPPHGNSHMKPVESSATTTEYATINFTPTYNAVKGTLV